MGFWQLGNTSVRSAMRIRDGLIAYSTSTIQGDIRGADGDIAFRSLLGSCGVVSLGEDDTNSVGRKWRSAMGKLGFIYPEISDDMGFPQTDLGQLDIITPAGWNLIRAETVPAMQECYLRAMVTPVFPMENNLKFSPLCWTLSLLLELDRRNESPSISFIEMALIVQTTNPSNGLGETVDRIIELRNRRNAAERKKVFDRIEYDNAAEVFNRATRTFKDYADMNIRYLKATGMVRAYGKGITLVSEKRALAIALSREAVSDKSWIELYRSLCNGNVLPTDNATVAYQVLEDLLQQLQQYNIDFTLEGRLLDTPAHINQARYEIEQIIAERKEEVYAFEQANAWREIAAYMDLIASRRDYMRLNEEVEIKVPRAEAPAYLEWSLWRAFLAIDTLVNKPYQVRRFNVDQDFMPVSTAPGNGPDLIAEFDDCVVVIEVTLSESSRQEAMEGEPVRRHIADLMLQYNKPVYGLFIANRIDSNTAETFRIGVWYTRDDDRMSLKIVPFTLTQFSSYFKAIFASETATPQSIVSLIEECETCRQHFEAPEWKQEIGNIVNAKCAALAN